MILTATPTTLAAAFKQAAPGDTIRVTGDGDTLTLPRGRTFNPPLTLDLRDATFKAVYSLQASGIVLAGLVLNSPPLASSNAQAIRLVQSNDITLQDCRVTGSPATNGVPFDALNPDATGNVIGLPSGKGIDVGLGNSRITIQRCEISGFHKGIVLGGGDDVAVLYNDVHNLRSTSISGAAGDRNRIVGNRTWDSRPWRFGASLLDGGSDGDHGDTAHFWTTAKPVADLTITENVFETGVMLGIYLDDNGRGLGFVNARIERNRIIGGHGQGILLERVSGTVSMNHLEWNGLGDQLHNAPRIVITAGSRDLTVRGNRAVNYASKSIDLYKLGAAEMASIGVRP